MRSTIVRTLTVGVAALIVLSAVALTGAGATQGTTEQIDADHPLASSEAIDTYDETGVVNGTVERIQLSLTIADDPRAAGLSRWRNNGAMNTYLRIDYDESVPRTIQFYVPADYWRPRPGELEAEDSDVTASLAETADGEYTAVTVHLSGETDTAFAIGREAGWYFTGRDRVDDIVNNTTGFSMPSIGPRGGQWDYLPASALAGANDTATIDTTAPDAMTIQYDDADDASDRRWLPVRACSETDAAVCVLQTGNDSRVTLAARTDDPPPVRYRRGDTGATGFAESVVNDVQQAVDNLVADVQGAIGGALGGVL